MHWRENKEGFDRKTRVEALARLWQANMFALQDGLRATYVSIVTHIVVHVHESAPALELADVVWTYLCLLGADVGLVRRDVLDLELVFAELARHHTKAALAVVRGHVLDNYLRHTAAPRAEAIRVVASLAMLGQLEKLSPPAARRSDNRRRAPADWSRSPVVVVADRVCRASGKVYLDAAVGIYIGGNVCLDGRRRNRPERRIMFG